MKLLLVALLVGQTWYDDVGLYWGSSDDNVCLYDTAQTADALVCGLGTDSERMIYTTLACVGTDMGLADAGTPTITLTDNACVPGIEITSTTITGIDVEDLSTSGAVGTVPTSDGVGGLSMALPSGGISSPLTSDLTINDDVGLYWGTSDDNVCLYDTVQTPDSLVCGLGTDSERLTLTTLACAGVTDIGLADAGTPTLGITDATCADVVEISHNGTNGVISTNAGVLTFPGGFAVDATDKVCLDGSACTSYIYESADNVVSLVSGGFNFMDLDLAGGGIYGNAPIISGGADPADAGALRLLNNDTIGWEANPTGTDGGLSFDTNNEFALTHTLNLTGDLEMASGASGTIDWASLVDVYSPANGQLTITNDAQSAGVTLDVDDYASTLVVKNQAGTGVGNLAIPTGGFLSFTGSALSSYMGVFATNKLSFVVNGLISEYTPGGITYYKNLQLIKVGGPMAITLYRNNNIAAATQTMQYAIYGTSRNASGTVKNFNSIVGYAEDGAAGAEDGSVFFKLLDAGADTTYLELNAVDGSEAVTTYKNLDMQGGATLPTQVAASPAAPVTCASGTLGRIEVVNDSDDGAATEVCYCGMTDDSTYDWLNIADNTACAHY